MGTSGKSYSRKSNQGVQEAYGSEGGRGQDFGVRAKRPRKSMPIALYPGMGMGGGDSIDDTPRYHDSNPSNINSFNERCGDGSSGRGSGSGGHSVGVLGKNSMDSRKRAVSNQGYLKTESPGPK